MKRFLSTAAATCCVAGASLGGVYTPETASREARFANPPASARILPIHHGRPNDFAKADAEIDALVRDGFGGFAGNVSFENYLESPEAWATYRHILSRARERGLVHWLYDEKGYPSCTAGGKTLEGHPEWQARAYLVAVTNAPVAANARPPSPPGKPVATLRRKSADGARETVYVVTDDYIREGTHVAISVSRYKYAYPNLLMAEPTARFIAITHDAYARELGADFAPSVTSTFTDEPSLMTLWMRPMPYCCLPVSDELLAAYARAVGHPLADDVPALIEGEPKAAVAAVRHRFWSMVGERVARNYTGQITKWCTAHGIESGGHLLAEEGLVSHVGLYGDFFRVLRGLSAPSADMLQSLPGSVPWLTPLLVGSAGELNGSRHTMSEASDHCQRYRAAGDKRPIRQVTTREIVGSLNRQIWGGIDTFTSYYNWKPFSTAERRAINEEIGRTLTLVQEGHSAAEIALLYPADSLMVGYEPKTRGGGGARAQATAGLVNTVGSALFSANRAFMFVDDASLAEAAVKDGALVKGALKWKTVILAGVSTLSAEAARNLAALRRAGGLVIAVGERPCNSRTAFPDAEMTRLTAQWAFLKGDRAVLAADLINACHTPTLVQTSGPDGALRTAHRRTSVGDVFFVMNDTAENWSGAVRLAGGVKCRVWNPRDGHVTAATGDVPLVLPPYAGVVLTTETPVEGRVDSRRAAQPLQVMFKPFAEPVAHVSLGKGRHVRGAATALDDGWQRVETTLAKGNVDTFAFLNRSYAKSPLAKGDRGIGFSLRVPETTGGHAIVGVFLCMRDGSMWYQTSPVSLSTKGEADVALGLGGFFLHGGRGKESRFRPEDIEKINIGYGGYFGREGERIVFEVSEPKVLVLGE